MKKFIILFITGALISSCANELNLEPQNSITEELALQDAEGLQSVLVGAYDRFTDDDLYGGWFQMTSDLLGTSNDVNWAGTFTDPGDIWNKVITTNNGQVEVTWTEAYNAINVVNTILANLDVVEDEDERMRMEGEAKFIRGTIYFDLVRLYARDWADGNPATNLGVPLKLTPTNLNYNAQDNFISRSTVAEVYQQAIADLTDAETMLPEDNGIYATTWAAKAILARIALQQRNFDEARTKANDIIENGPFALVDRVAREFNNRGIITSEDIFSIQITPQDGDNALQTFYASSALNGRRDIRIRAEYDALFDETDERRLELIYYDASGRRLSAKYQDQFGNIPMIRLAEMYLIRAEGNLMEGDQVGPNSVTEDLQVLRTRARASDASSEPSIDDIILERKLELAFEGNFLHDIRRNEGTIVQRGNYPWNSEELVLPIPQRELDANPALRSQQNPGYGGN